MEMLRKSVFISVASRNASGVFESLLEFLDLSLRLIISSKGKNNRFVVQSLVNHVLENITRPILEDQSLQRFLASFNFA